MTEQECERLVDSTASKLGIGGLLTRTYREELYKESDGHPYVVKILLGEIAKTKQLRKIERIVAASDEVLTALFERTYATLSPGAQRIFLTLSNWRTTIPKLAVEAVMLRNPAEAEIVPAPACIEELERSSFIDVVESQADKERFIQTPLVASLFGRGKLRASPLRSTVEADTDVLQQFGAGGQADIRHGVSPRIERLVKSLASRIAGGQATLSEYTPMLEYISRHYPTAWRLLAELHEEAGTPEGVKSAREAMRHYLETEPGGAGW